MFKVRVNPDYYILLCAKRYAEAARNLQSAFGVDARRSRIELMSYLLESGRLEFRQERDRRQRCVPQTFSHQSAAGSHCDEP